MQVERTKENLKSCQCMHCPSYTTGCKIRSMPDNIVNLMEGLDEVSHFESLFCAFEQSHCIHEDKGCLCSDCSVHKKYDLQKHDFCMKTGGL